MTDLTIRLDDLHQLAGLLPEATPPRMVAEVAQWAVELAAADSDRVLTKGYCFAARVIEDFEDDAPTRPEPVDAPEPEPEPETSPAPVPLLADVEDLDVAEPSSEAPGDKISENSGLVADADAQPEPKSDLIPPPPAPAPEPAPSHPFGKTWTESDDETLLSMYQSGARLVEIADALGRSVRAVDLRRNRLAKTDPRAKPAVKGSAVAAAAETAKRRQPRPPAPVATPPAADPVAQLVGRLAELDDNFEPADDELLVRQRYLGVGFADIAAELGCDEATAKARWREILKCGVKHAGGIVTEKGWDELRAAVAQRAAEVED